MALSHTQSAWTCSPDTPGTQGVRSRTVFPSVTTVFWGFEITQLKCHGKGEHGILEEGTSRRKSFPEGKILSGGLERQVPWRRSKGAGTRYLRPRGQRERRLTVRNWTGWSVSAACRHFRSLPAQPGRSAYSALHHIAPTPFGEDVVDPVVMVQSFFPFLNYNKTHLIHKPVSTIKFDFSAIWFPFRFVLLNF